MSSPRTFRDRSSWVPAAVAALAVAAAVAANGLALRTPFFPIDDPHYVTSNTALQQTSLSEWWRFFTTRTNPWEYLPLRDLSYRLDLAVFGMEPAGFRATNLLLYGLTCAAVWWFVVSLLRLLRREPWPDDGWIAALATALFAAHPAHVESVVWVAGRKDVLSGLFAVLSLAAFTRALAPTPPSRRWLAGAYALFACATLSKSTVTPVPVVAWLIAAARQDWSGQRGRALVRASAWAAPLFLLSLGSVVLQLWGSITYATEPFDGMGVRPLIGQVALAIRILGTLVRIAILPVGLRLIYDVDAEGGAAAIVTTLGLAAAVITLLGLCQSVRQRSLAWLGLTATGLLMAPFLQIVPFYTWSYASDRFLFLPVLGIGLAVAVWVWRLPRAPRWLAAVAFVLLGTTATVMRSLQWRDATALLTETARLAPAHYAAAELAIRYVFVPQRRFAEAHAAASLVRSPIYRAYLATYVSAHDALDRGDLGRLRPLVPTLLNATPREDYAARVDAANMALEGGLLTEAEREYRSIVADFAAPPAIRYNLGLTLARQGRHAEAADAMQSAIVAGYGTATVWNNLGLARMNAGQPEPAILAFRRALETDTRHWHAAYNMARLLWARGDRDGARDALREARRRAAAAGASTRALADLEQQMGSRVP